MGFHCFKGTDSLKTDLVIFDSKAVCLHGEFTLVDMLYTAVSHLPQGTGGDQCKKHSTNWVLHDYYRTVQKTLEEIFEAGVLANRQWVSDPKLVPGDENFGFKYFHIRLHIDFWSLLKIFHRKSTNYKSDYRIDLYTLSEWTAHTCTYRAPRHIFMVHNRITFLSYTWVPW